MLGASLTQSLVAIFYCVVLPLLYVGCLFVTSRDQAPGSTNLMTILLGSPDVLSSTVTPEFFFSTDRGVKGLEFVSLRTVLLSVAYAFTIS
jgi:hypothetical protein